MSIKLMSQVWECQVTHREQALLLALCDHADDNGRNVFPSVEYLEWKTDFDERTIQRIMKDLRNRGVLVVERKAGYKRPTNYRVNLSVLPRKQAFVRKGDRRSPYIQYEEETENTTKGDNLTPSTETDGLEPTARGDSLDEMGVKTLAEGDKSFPKGDTAVSHEPSLNHQRNSKETSGDVLSEKPTQIIVPETIAANCKTDELVESPRTEIQSEIQSLFRIHPEFDWTWLDPLLAEIPDKMLHLETARRLFDLGKTNASFDRLAFAKMLRTSNLRALHQAKTNASATC